MTALLPEAVAPARQYQGGVGVDILVNSLQFAVSGFQLAPDGGDSMCPGADPQTPETARSARVLEAHTSARTDANVYLARVA
jgi:hypothetical protein